MRYTGPTYRRSRRVGFSILENGKELAKKPFGPGQHGNGRKKKPSDYGTQLTEKQKVKFMYGLSEKQFKKTFVEAKKLGGVYGEDFLKLLESRIDNVVYRLGFAKTRQGARQMVNHGHITVNGSKVDIPSYRLVPGDIVSLREQSFNHPVVIESLESVHNRIGYIEYDENAKKGVFTRYPERSELNADIDESLIVEFYNR